MLKKQVGGSGGGVEGGMVGAVIGVRGVGEVAGGDRVSVLTVGNTLVLDLQVLISPRAGVWEHIRPCYHHTLGAVITPARGDRQRKEESRKEGRKERTEKLSDCSTIVRKTKRSGYKKTSWGSKRQKER